VVFSGGDLFPTLGTMSLSTLRRWFGGGPVPVQAEPAAPSPTPAESLRQAILEHRRVHGIIHINGRIAVLHPRGKTVDQILREDDLLVCRQGRMKT